MKLEQFLLTEGVIKIKKYLDGFLRRTNPPSRETVQHIIDCLERRCCTGDNPEQEKELVEYCKRYLNSIRDYTYEQLEDFKKELDDILNQMYNRDIGNHAVIQKMVKQYEKSFGKFKRDKNVEEPN